MKNWEKIFCIRRCVSLLVGSIVDVVRKAYRYEVIELKPTNERTG